jgi:hypothetical protein
VASSSNCVVIARIDPLAINKRVGLWLTLFCICAPRRALYVEAAPRGERRSQACQSQKLRTEVEPPTKAKAARTAPLLWEARPAANAAQACQSKTQKLHPEVGPLTKAKAAAPPCFLWEARPAANAPAGLPMNSPPHQLTSPSHNSCPPAHNQTASQWG